MQLFIIRHGQSFNNALWAKTGGENGRLSDPHLTELGQQQAVHLAQHNAQADKNGFANTAHDQHNSQGYHLTHLYTSLMLRAVQTGHTIADALDMPLNVWESIHEWGGIFEYDPETGNPIPLPGSNRAFFAERFPRLILPDWLQDEGWWQRPFEPREDSAHRADKFISELLDRHGGTDERVGIVTHGGFTGMVLRAIFNSQEYNLNLSDQEIRTRFRISNTSLGRIDFEGSTIMQIYMNCVDHLPTSLIT